ncbi:hypothetical protein Ciccas_013488 [Cichlidogyrus casuarinus]|uniref:Uncharacterized protein n=1 Tax=Cichlidogyrus casuarinus TaxID=1844966 RepID=A0ABD2PM94_9PLAT
MSSLLLFLALVSSAVSADICSEDNFSLLKECSAIGYEADTNLDINVLRSMTLLNEHVKRITTYCDRMHFCVKYTQMHSHVSLSDVMASWKNTISRNKICINLPCYEKLLAAYSCLRPVPTTVLQVVKMLCGLSGFTVNEKNGDVGENTEPINLICLSSALALAQYAAAEGHRANSSMRDAQLGLHPEQCGQHTCPGPDCPETCLENARKYACLHLRCQDRAEAVDAFFAWMMGENQVFLSSIKPSSIESCALELPLVPKSSESELDSFSANQDYDETRIEFLKRSHHIALAVVGICAIVGVLISVFVCLFYRRTADLFVHKRRHDYLRMSEVPKT